MMNEHEYDRRCLMAAKLYIRNQDCIFFDIGANVGNFSISLANLFCEKKYLIYAFEPNPNAYAALQNNILSKNIILNNFGFSDQEEDRDMYLPGNLSVLGSLYNRKVFSEMQHAWGDVSSQKIKLKKLDNFVQQEGIKNIDYLKIDTEGHEMAVLRGSENCFKEKIVNCGQFEYGGCFEDSNTKLIEIYNYFQKNNYSIYDLSDNSLLTFEKAKQDDYVLRNYFFIDSERL